MSSIIFEEGLPQLLIDIIKLAENPVEDKKEKKKILKMPLESAFDLLEDYVKMLPFPQDMEDLTVKNRIMIANIRNILLGFSKALDVHLMSLFRICKKNIAQKEAQLKLRELNINELGGRRKPHSKKITKQAKITLDKAETIIEAPNIFKELSFFDGQPTGITLLEEFPVSDLPEKKGDDSGPVLIDPPFEDGRNHRETAERRQSENEKTDDAWPVLEDFINPLLQDLRTHREALEKRLSQATPLVLDTEKKKTESPTHRDQGIRPKYKCIEFPHFSQEEYEKLLQRKANRFHNAIYNHELLEELISKKYKSQEKDDSDYLFNFDFGIPCASIPAIHIKTPLALSLRPPTPPVIDSEAVGFHKIEILDLVRPTDELLELDELRAASFYRPSIYRISQLDAVPLSAVEQEVLPVTVIRPSEPAPFLEPSVSEFIMDPFLQAQEPYGRTSSPPQAPPVPVPEPLPVLPPERVLSTKSESEVMDMLKGVCTSEIQFTVNFLILCPISESRLSAANIFQHLMNLWKEKRVHMYQTGTSPSEVYIKLNPEFL